MNRRAWTLLIALSAIWGASYMFIKIGIRDFSPAMVAWARIALAAMILVGLAGSRGALAGFRAHVPTIAPARRGPGRRAVPADLRRRAGDLLIARRDPGHLDAAVHRPARDLGRSRGALARPAARRRPARCRGRRSAPRRRSRRQRRPAPRRLGRGPRGPRVRDRRADRQAPARRRAADRPRGVGDGGQHRCCCFRLP